MSDDLLGDILDATRGGAQPPPAPRRDLGDLLGRAVAGAGRAAAGAPPPTLDALLRLDGPGWKAFLRYLPSELLVPLVGGASMPVARRLVESLDAEGQAWLQSQSEAIERCTAAEHAAAAAKALAVLARLQDDGRLRLQAAPVAAAPAPAAAPASRPPQITVAFNAEPGPAPRAASAPAPVAVRSGPAAPTAAAPGDAAWVEGLRRGGPDPLVETLAALVAAARGRPPAELAALAEGLEHPVLAAGLRALAAGADAHHLAEALRQAEEAWLDERRCEVAVVREALLAIRFGDGAEAFRARL